MVFLSENADSIKMAGKKQNMAPMSKKMMKNIDLDEPTSFLAHVYLGCTQRDCKTNEIIIKGYSGTFESRISVGATEKLPGWEKPQRKDGCVVLRHGRAWSKNR